MPKWIRNQETGEMQPDPLCEAAKVEYAKREYFNGRISHLELRKAEIAYDEYVAECKKIQAEKEEKAAEERSNKK